MERGSSQCKLSARGKVARVRDQDRKKIRSESGREKEKNDELGRLARRLREELQRKFVKCKQECLAMLDSRATRSSSRKGFEKKRTARRSKRRSSRDQRSKRKKSPRNLSRRSREGNVKLVDEE